MPQARYTLAAFAREKRRAGVTVGEQSAFATLLPIMAVAFTAYLLIGFAMPVLPLHVHQGLGFGTFVVGLVSGSQCALLWRVVRRPALPFRVG